MFFFKASRVPEKDLITTIIKKDALQAYQHACERLANEEQEFYSSFERLLAVREEHRVKAANAEFGEEVNRPFRVSVMSIVCMCIQLCLLFFSSFR